jgi:hypothetical protein
MDNKTIYYYKLVSPFIEDITKNCKLTVNDIDSNFFNLKCLEIKDGYIDDNKQELVLERFSGDTVNVDISSIYEAIKNSMSGDTNNHTYDLDVSYSIESGSVIMTWTSLTPDASGNTKHEIVIDGLLTRMNASGSPVSTVITDGTLRGNGTATKPLRLNPVEVTGHYRPVKSVIDLTSGDTLPTSGVACGDRFLSYEAGSPYGYLYDDCAVEKIKCILSADTSNEWRVPTKDDWDLMLNSLEPCQYQNHNEVKCHACLGKYAGALLKSSVDWKESPASGESAGCLICDCGTDCGCSGSGDTLSTVTVNPAGIGYNNFDVYPAGWGDHGEKPLHVGEEAAFWTDSYIGDDILQDKYDKIFRYDTSMVEQDSLCPDGFASLRLVKDYNGNNAYGVEEILGNSYTTSVFTPKHNINVNQVWMDSNLMKVPEGCEDHCVLPSSGDSEMHLKKVYYVNEFNGCSWDRKALVEGDVIVVNSGINGDAENSEYVVVTDADGNQALKNTDDLVYNRLMNTVSSITDSLSGAITSINSEIEALSGANDVEKVERIAADSALTDDIEAIKKAAGLDSEGNYVSDSADTILSASTSLADADKKLSDEAKALDKRINSEMTIFGSLFETVANSVTAISGAVDDEKARAISAETAIDSQLIVNGNYDLSGGTLTLGTKNADTPNIIIQWDSNYGEI